jgi:heme-degrading monooxygenase HmoA
MFGERRQAGLAAHHHQEEEAMTAYNAVRFRVKPGMDQAFVDKNRAMAGQQMPGLRKAALVKTGDRTYCFIGEWDSFDAIVRNRDQMIADLDGFRDMLEDLGGGLGVTDPVSGEAVLEI